MNSRSMSSRRGGVLPTNEASMFGVCNVESARIVKDIPAYLEHVYSLIVGTVSPRVQCQYNFRYENGTYMMVQADEITQASSARGTMDC